ncbi:hypothetical protein [Psychrobacter sp. JCM 18901]
MVLELVGDMLSTVYSRFKADNDTFHNIRATYGNMSF